MIKKSRMRGYTLLELIVSLGIFSMVMLVVTGAYLTLIALDKQARVGNQLAASLSFAVESMSRNLRTGVDYSCNGNVRQDCPLGGTSISFIDSEGQAVAYRVKADGSIGQCQLAALGDACTDSAAVALTDPRIDIEYIHFYVRGATPGDGVQPQVLYAISGSMETSRGQRTGFTIQSAATQRIIDL